MGLLITMDGRGRAAAVRQRWSDSWPIDPAVSLWRDNLLADLAATLRASTRYPPTPTSAGLEQALNLPVSYTVLVRLPAAGSSLNVWPEFTYPDDVPHLDKARALSHGGVSRRITLQGHGLMVNDQHILC
jgi:hypothetical protein